MPVKVPKSHANAKTFKIGSGSRVRGVPFSEWLKTLFKWKIGV